MTTPAPDDFQDVLSLLAETELPVPQTLAPAVRDALAAPASAAPTTHGELLARDGDEAWSLARTYLGSDEAAREALVEACAGFAPDALPTLTPSQTLSAVALACAEIGRLLSKGGSDLGPLAPAPRLALLLRVGIGLPAEQVGLAGGAALAEALAAACPRGSADELALLEARALLGELGQDERPRLEILRGQHPTGATLLRERYAELAEVPPLLLVGAEELAEAAAARQAGAAEQARRGELLRLQIRVGCCYCHDGLERSEAVYCASCLAPHHAECFTTHGRCATPGCEAVEVVRPSGAAQPAATSRPAPSRWVTAAAASLALLVGGLGAAAWSELRERQALASYRAAQAEAEREAPGREGGPSPAASPSAAPELLQAARERLERLAREREQAAAKNAAIERRLEEGRFSMVWERRPLLECLRELTQGAGLSFTLSSDASDLIETEQPAVSLRLSRIKLGSALALALAAHPSLTYTLDRGAIVIRTEEEVAGEVLLEVYDVRDLLAPGPRRARGRRVSAGALIELLEELGEQAAAEVGSVECAGGYLAVRRPRLYQRVVLRVLATLRGEEEAPAAAEPPAWTTRIEAQLEQRVTLSDSIATLGSAALALEDALRVTIRLGRTVDGESRVTARIQDLPARDALDLLLEPLGLVWTLRDQGVQISSPDERPRPIRLAVLPVDDIVARFEDPETLVELIRNSTGEDLWDAPTSLRCDSGALLICQTEAGLERVEEVLARLRVAQAQPPEQR